MKRTIILASISILCFLQVGWGQIPQTMSYQGVLKDAGGNLLDGPYNLAFGLWDVETGGTAPLWTESHSSVPVANGIFTVILGSNTPLDLDFDAQYWLQVTVDGDFLSPRTPLTAAPYALIARNNWSLTGNSGTTAGTNFLGTSDNMALQLHVNGARALRLEPAVECPNVIGGFFGNNVSSGLFGATIGGGGYTGEVHEVTDHWGTVGGGYNNTAGNSDGTLENARWATVSGGQSNTASGSDATVGGGYNNTASASGATVGGGDQNAVSGVRATVGGGSYNAASGSESTVGGGYSNDASVGYATIGGGYGNAASGNAATVPGGYQNAAVGHFSLAAGRRAKANDDGAFVWADGTDMDFVSTAANQFLIRAAGGVGIGTNNPATALDVAGTVTATAFSGSGSAALDFQVNNARALRLEPDAISPNVIGGHSGNTVTTGVYGATIGGGGVSGYVNQVTANYGSIGGGFGNSASNTYTSVGGGYQNTASAVNATVGGGWGNTASGVTATTVGGGNNNTASGDYATVPGGYFNVAGGYYSFAAGRQAKANHSGTFVWADGTAADFATIAPDEFAVRATGGFRFLTSVDGSGLRLEPHATSPNVIGGYSGNNATTGVYGATIGGGGASGYTNRVFDNFGTVGGGYNNTVGNNDGTVSNDRYATVSGGESNSASDDWATVGGGYSNATSGQYATISGGYDNTASGGDATVGGGQSNTASNSYATVPGGVLNTAAGFASFAAGRQANANHDGCFVWADSYASNFTSTGADRFMVRASGGVYFYTSTTLDDGLYLPANGNAWSNLSDRNMKENFVEEDGEAVLAAIADMPIPSWNYKSQGPAIRHIGPMAQDFNAAFGLGEDERYINTLDIDGINLLAVQALEKRTEELKGALQKLNEKTQRIDEQAQEIEALQAAVTSLEAQIKVAVRE